MPPTPCSRICWPRSWPAACGRSCTSLLAGYRHWPASTILQTDVFATAVTENLTSAYAALRAFAVAVGGLDLQAAAVVVTSVGAHRAHRYHAGYDAAKAGVESVVRTLALEYGSRLSVRAFALGPLAESTSTAADGEASSALVRLVPLGRYARLAEVAEAIALFGGPAFDPVNGHTLTFDGGLSVQLRPVEVERAPPEESGTLGNLPQDTLAELRSRR